MSAIVERYVDTEALVAAAGDRLVAAILDAIDKRGVAQIVLTGGGSGTGLLKRVAERGERIDWSKVHLFWGGDDRFVPEDDDERNYKQAREALLDHVDIPAANVHAMAASDGEFGDDLDAAAAAYERVLVSDFDVHLLGMGGEGARQLAVPAHARGAGDRAVGGRGSPTPPPSHRHAGSR